ARRVGQPDGLDGNWFVWRDQIGKRARRTSVMVFRNAQRNRRNSVRGRRSLCLLRRCILRVRQQCRAEGKCAGQCSGKQRSNKRLHHDLGVPSLWIPTGSCKLFLKSIERSRSRICFMKKDLGRSASFGGVLAGTGTTGKSV